MSHPNRYMAFQFQPKALPASPLEQWTKRFHDTERLASDAVERITGRESAPPPTMPRRAAEIRRKVAIVDTRLGLLQEELSQLPNKQRISPVELSKLAEKLSALDSKVKEVTAPFTMKHSSNRDDLLGPSDDCIRIDIDSTSEMDSRQIIDLQRKIMKEQDAGLDKLEETIYSTKHIALAINEELDLHTPLIVDLDERVDDTSNQLQLVLKRLKSLNRRIRKNGSRVHLLCSVIAIGVCVAIAWAFIKYS